MEPNVIEASTVEPPQRMSSIQFKDPLYDAGSDSVRLIVEAVDMQPGDVFILTREFVEHPMVFGKSGPSVIAGAIKSVGKEITKSLIGIDKTLNKKPRR